MGLANQKIIDLLVLTFACRELTGKGVAVLIPILGAHGDVVEPSGSVLGVDTQNPYPVISGHWEILGPRDALPPMTGAPFCLVSAILMMVRETMRTGRSKAFGSN
jgi:hypothetical protein